MQRIIILFFAMMALFPALRANDALGAVRVALVIGNGSYSYTAPLPNPPNDARAVADKLAGLGFEVFAGVDLDQQGMRSLTRDFARALTDAEVGLVFYAGHGLQVNGENYLLPVDAALEHPSDLAFESLSLTDLMGQVEDAGRTSIVILDACRNNPLSRSFQRKSRSANVGQGLARLSAGTGALIAFATAPGDVALDGTGANSPFTEALLAEIDTPGVEINQLMTRVRARVYESTGQDQLPWTNSALLGEFFFVPGAATPQPAAPTVQPPDALVWQAISQSKDRTDFESFLATYPSSPFAPLAHARLARFGDGEQQLAALPSSASDPTSGLDAPASNRLELRVKTLDGIMGEGVTGRGFRLQGPLDGLISDLTETPSGLLVAAGVSISPDAGTSEGWVAAISQNGKLDLQRYIGNHHTSWLSAVTKLGNDTYVAAGAAAAEDSDPFAPWIVAFDLSGAVIWSQRLDAPAGGWIHDIATVGEGNAPDLILSGYRVPRRGGQSVPSLWRLDNDGNTLWQSDLGASDLGTSKFGPGKFGPGKFGEARGILPQTDGSVLVTGMLEQAEAGASDIALWRVSGDGSLVWSKRLASPMADRGVALAMLDERRAVAVGTRGDAAIAMLVDADRGETSALEPLSGSLERSWANAVTKREGGGLIAVGSGLRPGTETESVWLAEIDTSGQLAHHYILDSQGDDEVYTVHMAANGRIFVAGLYGGERLFSVLMGGEPWIAELMTP